MQNLVSSIIAKNIWNEASLILKSDWLLLFKKAHTHNEKRIGTLTYAKRTLQKLENQVI